MRVKVALLDTDTTYINRLVATFNSKYADKLEIYSFTSLDVAYETIEDSKIDVLLANDSFEINVEDLPRRCAFAYFVETAGIENIKDSKAIFKYQKAELIYKQILNIFSEKASDISGVKISDSTSKMILFTSPAGGVGSSTIAAACALNRAKKGARTLYLNLETAGTADMYFNADGQFGMSDIIYALKSQKANLPLKLESCVKQDDRGVYFFSQSKLALDMVELKLDEVEILLMELKKSGLYDYIVVDMQFRLDKNYAAIYSIMDRIVVVSDGSMTANTKVSRAISALSTMCHSMDVSVVQHMLIIYNKFQKICKVLPNEIIKSAGGVSFYQNTTEEHVVETISDMMIFDNIM